MNDELAGLNDAFSGQVGVHCMLEGDEFAAFQADKRFATASTIKIFLLGAILEGVSQKHWSLDTPLNVTSDDLVGGSGIIKGLSPPLSLCLRDMATLMMTVSDNTATNLLLDHIGGVNAVNAHIGRSGLVSTGMGSRIDFSVIGDDFDKLGVSTPREMTAYLEGIRSLQILEKAEAESFLAFMRFQHYLDLFPRHLPFNPYAKDLGQRQCLSIANKTGFVPGIRCDVGYLFQQGKTVSYCVMSHQCRDLRFSVDNEGNQLLGRIGELAYSYAFQ